MTNEQAGMALETLVHRGSDRDYRFTRVDVGAVAVKSKGWWTVEDKALKASKDKLDKLNREVKSLTQKEQETRRRLDDEREILNKITEQRTALVDRLVNAAPGDQAPGRLHSQIDEFDVKIKASQRLVESFERLLQTIKVELESIVGERNIVNAIVGQAENQRAFEQWRQNIQSGIADAHEKLAAARLALGNLNTGFATGLEKFGASAAVLVEKIDEFIVTEGNPERLGFEVARPFFRNDLKVMIHPMVRRG